MGWFRSNGGRATWLAFFALACQFVFAFGHVHIGNASVASPALTLLADAVKGSANAPSSPAPNTPSSLVPDFCAVCSSINLAHTLVLPASPTVIPPGSFIYRPQRSLAAVAPTARDHFHFDARGPPHA